MKNILTICSLFFLVYLSSCATKTETWTPVGTWDYTVKDTPSGDGYGTLVFTKEKGDITGMLRSPEYGDSELSNLVIEGEKLTAEIYLSGLDMTFEGTFEGDNLTGRVIAGTYGEFPLTAIRQSEQ